MARRPHSVAGSRVARRSRCTSTGDSTRLPREGPLPGDRHQSLRVLRGQGLAADWTAQKRRYIDHGLGLGKGLSVGNLRTQDGSEPEATAPYNPVINDATQIPATRLPGSSVTQSAPLGKCLGLRTPSRNAILSN